MKVSGQMEEKHCSKLLPETTVLAKLTDGWAKLENILAVQMICLEFKVLIPVESLEVNENLFLPLDNNIWVEW